MIRDAGAGLAFARSWLSDRADVVAREIELNRGDRTVPATLYQPARGAGAPTRGWIMLHGATVPGRRHAQLVRFARSVAHTGATVLVPDVPEWTALRLAPALTLPTVRAAVPALRALPEVGERPVGLIGFSFGAPHAVLVGADPGMARTLAAIVGFGGYCDLSSALRFLFLGEYEWKGERHRATPDPYGRWIVAGNYLTSVPGHEDAADVARALFSLAAEAGDRGLPAGDPSYDSLKRALEAAVAPERRALLGLIAPPGDALPRDREAAAGLADALVSTIHAVDPEMDPAPRLSAVRVPVRLLHGHGDTLIPYTETLRLGERLEGATDVRVDVTKLFSHTQDESMPAGLRLLAEQIRFVRAVGRVLRMS